MNEVKFQVGFPEPLYPEDPDTCTTQDLEWWGKQTRGRVTRFEMPDRSFHASHVHCVDDVPITTFQTQGHIALRFGEHRVWFPKSRTAEIVEALLWEADQPLDTQDRLEASE